MKLEITFELEKPLRISIHYHYEVQGLIYGKMSKDYGDFMHGDGYKKEGKSYKLFSFSRLEGKSKFNKKYKEITFYDNVKITISSIIPHFLRDLANNFMLSDSIYLFNHKLKVTQIKTIEDLVNTNKILVRAISPITTYTTYERRDGSKFTHYFKPEEQAFQHLVEENVINKYETYYNTKLNTKTRFLIKPVKVTQKDKVVTKYKNTIINAWGGLYRLEASKELLEFALAVGASSKASQGFGLLSLEKELT
ncbi:CRISPR-associated endoribonuclease Cas6 [Natranaerofaba carboxydovora]|uniref:CRISPR-associated endoribonuclease Cas6 n=1 Tax=Natranaerofaba carboxydovora TaxID=2742683 RepID=UPI001F143F3F|nr:CRISPR-associated endoribonuclease Cas6 [Natranaerofaba carboxydovora]UMZ72704.1 CRISPR associated protein Cas6 [Natranaerofaba carboxydovora]